MYVLVLPKNVVKFFFKNPVTFLFVKRLDCCLYSNTRKKINENCFIAMTLIMNVKSSTASNMINAGINKYLDGLKHYDGRSIIKF